MGENKAAIHSLKDGKRPVGLQLRLVESELLSRIHRDFPPKTKARYRDLIGQRDAGVLSPKEHRELIRLTDQVERWQAERMNALADLAAFRKAPIDELLQELDLKPLLDD